jgi:DNA-binding NarL/FixJ family response regulator
MFDISSKMCQCCVNSDASIYRDSVQLRLAGRRNHGLEPFKRGLFHIQYNGVTTVPEERQEEKHIRVVDNSYASRLPLMSASADAPIEFGPTSGGSRPSQVISYWNRDGNPTIIVGVVDEHLFTRECITGFLQELGAIDAISFASCEECTRSTRHQDLILYHHRRAKDQRINNQEFVQLKGLVQISPVIILSDVDCRDSIIAAFDRGARGFIPTGSTTAKQVIEIIRLVNAGGAFVPPSCLSLRRVGGSGLPPPAITTHQFTPRELAVLERLSLGKANKTIAYELQMGESTVKAHIRSIMNKLKVKNRTEVVCRAYDLGDIGALPEA